MTRTPKRSLLAYLLCGVLPAAVLAAFAAIFYKVPLFGGVPVVWFALTGLAGISFSRFVEPSREAWPMSGFVAGLLLVGVAASATFAVLLAIVFFKASDSPDWPILLTALVAALPTSFALHYVYTLGRSLIHRPSNEA
jgi:hypothetical protein